MVNDINNGFKKILLRISVTLGILLLISSVLLMLQIDTLLGFNAEIVNERPSPSIAELPELEGYTLRANATDYQIELFEILVNAHDQFNVTGADEDLKDYASAIVRNFVADFFTLSNKNSRSDVGGLQFFSQDVVRDFREFAIDKFYLYLNQHIETFGSESLPTVATTTVLNNEFSSLVLGVEDENNELYDDENSQFPNENDNISGEVVRTIIIDLEWSYEHTTLPYISEFQTKARFVLVVHEEHVQIYVIELIETDYENPIYP